VGQNPRWPDYLITLFNYVFYAAPRSTVNDEFGWIVKEMDVVSCEVLWCYATICLDGLRNTMKPSVSVTIKMK